MRPVFLLMHTKLSLSFYYIYHALHLIHTISFKHHSLSQTLPIVLFTHYCFSPFICRPLQAHIHLSLARTLISYHAHILIVFTTLSNFLNPSLLTFSLQIFTNTPYLSILYSHATLFLHAHQAAALENLYKVLPSRIQKKKNSHISIHSRLFIFLLHKQTKKQKKNNS